MVLGSASVVHIVYVQGRAYKAFAEKLWVLDGALLVAVLTPGLPMSNVFNTEIDSSIVPELKRRALLVLSE